MPAHALQWRVYDIGFVLLLPAASRGKPAPTLIAVCRTIVEAGLPREEADTDPTESRLYRQLLNRWFRVQFCVVHRTVS